MQSRHLAFCISSSVFSYSGTVSHTAAFRFTLGSPTLALDAGRRPAQQGLPLLREKLADHPSQRNHPPPPTGQDRCRRPAKIADAAQSHGLRASRVAPG
ncbi:hypothetical protein THIX_60408 [Thiomonas sp. X19]|nr:hypothetical protein THIX_60408 [Thiomonas sp. X19]